MTAAPPQPGGGRDARADTITMPTTMLVLLTKCAHVAGRRSVHRWDGPNGRAAASEAQRRRQPDHRPCPARYGRCSVCVHAEAWQRRGNRPFLGVDAERNLRAVGR